MTTDPPSTHPPKPTHPVYRLYVDESGDHTYRALHEQARRHLALLGIWFGLSDDYERFVEELTELKTHFWGPRQHDDDPIILHREDIMARRGPFSILRDPEVATAFDDELLSLIRRAHFKIVLVLIDKQAHLDRYREPFDPYCYSLAALLDRYCGWLTMKGSRGDVMAEVRGAREDGMLQAAYARVLKAGTLMFRAPRHSAVLTSSSLKIKPKHHDVAGLQLADILAQPLKMACLAHETAAVKPTNVGTKLVCAVHPKFNRKAGDGTLRGYGIVRLP